MPRAERTSKSTSSVPADLPPTRAASPTSSRAWGRGGRSRRSLTNRAEELGAVAIVCYLPSRKHAEGRAYKFGTPEGRGFKDAANRGRRQSSQDAARNRARAGIKRRVGCAVAE